MTLASRPAVILGAISGSGGGMLRDPILGQVSTVLRRELYAIPALLGAGVVVTGYRTASLSPAFPILGACLCLAIWMVGVRYGIRSRPASAVAGRPTMRPRPKTRLHQSGVEVLAPDQAEA